LKERDNFEYKIALISNRYFKFITPYDIREDFGYDERRRKWDYHLRQHVMGDVHDYLFSKVSLNREYAEYEFGIGWLPYILYHYGELLHHQVDTFHKLIADPIEYKAEGLRGDQQNDLDALLKYRRGIFQVFTGYGKTQIIAHLVNYVVNIRKERLLLLAPGQKALDEIDNRVSRLFGITHKYFDYDSDYNAINVNGFPRSKKFDRSNLFWNTVDWIIAEEAEYIVADTSKEIMELCSNVTRAYAFSATADKVSGERIRMREGNIPVVQRNKELISYFGFASVYRKPERFKIHIKEVVTTMFDDVTSGSELGSTYSEMIYAIFTNKRFCEGLRKIVQRESPIYVPMGRLEVIDYWVANYFNISDFVVINICGRGYELYVGGDHKCNLTLEAVKGYIEDERVHLITGTSSSYRALDFPKLNKILPLTSKLASMVIQAIGRVSRRGEFTIINLKPVMNVSIYTRDFNNRKRLISNYYSDCEIITDYIREDEHEM
jgi:hypothetical protein